MELAGHETAMLCELDPDARAVLAERFPHVPARAIRPDITQLEHLPRADVVTAGFPCQDLSQAGRTAGITGKQSRLVDHVFALLEKQRPRARWVILENVQNMLRLDRGRAIHHVTQRFEALGYAWAYRVLDSRAFGLPQRRHRVFLVATRDGDPCRVLFSQTRTVTWPEDSGFHDDAGAYGFYWTEGNRGVGWARDAVPTLKGGSGIGIPSPPAIWWPAQRPAQAFVTPGIEDAEALQGFSRGWTAGSAEHPVRAARRWRMIGNAVSVPVAQWLGEALKSNGAFVMPPQRRMDDGSPWPNAAYGFRGAARMAVDVGTWPVAAPRIDLRTMIHQPIPLTAGAARGFFGRLTRSSLSHAVAPEAFREALAAYCAQFDDLARHASRRAQATQHSLEIATT